MAGKKSGKKADPSTVVVGDHHRHGSWGVLRTAELAQWCYPRLRGPIQHKHGVSICRAAKRIAVRVRRDRLALSSGAPAAFPESKHGILAATAVELCRAAQISMRTL